MNRHQLKERLKSVKRSTWIYLSVMTLIVALAIGLGIMAMYLSGYTLVTWLQNFYPWLLVGLGIALVVVLSVVLHIYRKRR